jgi:3-deoxy-D-manno-octulosonate 8-phosphate phosphatase (KDO 8-P phosphatase)
VTDNLKILDATSLAKIIRNIRLVAFDFDGVFTDNTVYVLEDGREAVRCTRSDGLGLTKLKALGVSIVIVSTETNPVVQARSRKLAIKCINGCNDKLAVINELAAQAGISLDQVAFVGNDVNDLPCLTSVGLPIVVKDAHADVVPYASYQTEVAGGYGAVREVCDLFERVLKGTHH